MKAPIGCITATIAQAFVGPRAGQQYYDLDPVALQIERYTTTRLGGDLEIRKRSPGDGFEALNIFDARADMIERLPAAGRTLRATLKGPDSESLFVLESGRAADAIKCCDRRVDEPIASEGQRCEADVPRAATSVPVLCSQDRITSRLELANAPMTSRSAGRLAEAPRAHSELPLNPKSC